MLHRPARRRRRQTRLRLWRLGQNRVLPCGKPRAARRPGGHSLLPAGNRPADGGLRHQQAAAGNHQRKTGDGTHGLTRSASTRSVITKFLVLVVATSGCLVLRTFAAAPLLTPVEPSAAIPGSVNLVTLAGENLDGALDLWTSFPCEVSPADRPGAPSFRLKISREIPPGLGAIRLITTNGISNPQ